jgi:hypothetical protein
MIKTKMKRIDEIESRAAAATRGPWIYDGMHNEICAPESPDKYFLITGELRSHPNEKIIDEYGHSYNPDFDFVANAGEDIPWLIKEYRKVAKERDAYKAKAEARTENPSASCPVCGAECEDFDGIGVLHCEKCGYCEHAARDFDGTAWVCVYCGDREEHESAK